MTLILLLLKIQYIFFFHYFPVLSQDTRFPGMGSSNTADIINNRMAPNIPDIAPKLRNPDSITNPSTLPPCANMMCTMEYIPEDCRDTPVLVVNGVRCLGCDSWAEHCRNDVTNLPSPAPDVSPPPEVTCPTLSCPLNTGIPPGCEYIETYDYFGRQCDKCPVWRSGCTESSGQIPCPLQDCKMEYIPPQCREIPTFTFMGRKCAGCPQRTKNCNIPVQRPQRVNSPEIFEVACPLLDCGEPIPAECRERNTYKTKTGKVCPACPTWKKSCKPVENVVPSNNIVASNSPRMACPLLDCRGNIPKECVEQVPYEFQGQVCYECPKWKAGCIPANQKSWSPKSCPLMRCEPLNVPIECLEDVFYTFEGQRCQGCPGVKQECKPLVNVKPVGGLDRVLTEAIEITTSDGCPPQRCPLIHIPFGCEERESFIYNGRTCYKCPIRRADCGQDAVRCPPMPCPLIYIPPECEEKQPYLYQGKTCYRCPKRKQECLPSADGPNFYDADNSVDVPECPPVKCPLVLIPKQCEEKQPFQYKGRTCYGCPKWRKGCSPPNTVTPESDKIACPLFGCPRTYIPNECLERQPYDFQGKVCYMCPKWREGCIPKNGNGIPGGQFVNSNPSVISIDTSHNDQISCPLFGCTRIKIPAECVEEQPYDFNGKTCYKCPKWRLGCVPSIGSTPKEGGCPAILNCPPIEIPIECREETPYMFQGHTCYGCPKFRDGCVPSKKIPEEACPLMACPRIYIPTECRVDHPYNVNGKTCYKCPTRKTPCVINEGGLGPKIPSKTECPLLDCPDVRIPKECMEIKTYKFEGQTCEKCPSWKMGCSPAVPLLITDDNQAPSLAPSVTEIPVLTDVPCPPVKCPRILIPEECRLEQAYKFQGKTCYKCPLWEPGCLSVSSKQSKSSPVDKPQESGSSTTAELTPRRLLLDTNMAAIFCPVLRCPRVPVHCQEQTTYNYRGRMCVGCPTWSSRCDSRNINMNG